MRPGRQRGQLDRERLDQIVADAVGRRQDLPVAAVDRVLERGERALVVARAARDERVLAARPDDLGLAVVDQERRRRERRVERALARLGALVGGGDAHDVVAVGDRLGVPVVLGLGQRIGAAERPPDGLVLLAEGEAVDRARRRRGSRPSSAA